VLAARGWAITYLGPDTPVATIRDTLGQVEPRIVVVAAASAERLRAAEPELAELARHVPLALAGGGATAALAGATGAALLDGDPVSAAENLSAFAL
jgi:methanogenic corrinoid protein MtbC1